MSRRTGRDRRAGPATRVRVAVEPGGRRAGVAIRRRGGSPLSRRLPHLENALARWSRGLKAAVVLEGTVEPDGAFVADRVIRDGGEDVSRRSPAARRARLERILGNVGSPLVRLAPFAAPEPPSRARAARPSRDDDDRGVPHDLRRIVDELRSLEVASRDGVLALPGGQRLEVTRLDKVFWPGLGITKGELMRYYVRVSPWLLPAVADRPLIMRRFPDGIAAKAFYQQRANADAPSGVRIERLPVDRVVPRRIIGGSLLTLLYMTQIASISQDPWFSRVGALDDADHAVIDLDPMPGVPFATVLDVARFVRDELDRLAVPNVPKTSGASGVHVYVPLAPRTSYATARLFAQIVATAVARAHPRVATIERSVDARGRKVYVDYLQNSRGKTLATAYSARASDFAGASTPLTWREIDDGVDRRDFTIRTLPARLRERGDLWAPLRTGRPADLDAALARLAAADL